MNLIVPADVHFVGGCRPERLSGAVDAPWATPPHDPELAMPRVKYWAGVLPSAFLNMVMKALTDS